jgi:hypothetical protein
MIDTTSRLVRYGLETACVLLSGDNVWMTMHAGESCQIDTSVRLWQYRSRELRPRH